jgi:hypothetical protein
MIAMKYKQLQERFIPFFLPLVLIGFAFAVMLPYMPPHYINRDSGIFLYIGRQITQGKLLYVDMWDHKGPLLFYINALGYWLGKRNGVWLIECIFLSIATTTGYAIFRKIVNPVFALFGTIAWLYTFFCIIAGGNFSEEFSIPLSFLSVYFFLLYLEKERKIFPFLIGILMGLSAMLRPNNIGIQLVIAAIIIFPDIWHRNIARAIRNGCLFCAGVLLVLAPISLFFYSQGAFYEFINATFLFNFLYASENNASAISVIPLFLIIMGWPCWFAIAGWFLLLKDSLIKPRKLTAAIASLFIIGFPVEFALDTLSGRPYIHYALMLLPYVGFLNAFFLSKLFPFFKKQNNPARILVYMLLVSTLLLSFWIGNEFIKSLDQASPKVNENSEIVTFIKNNSKISDYLLVWGQELSINVLSERESPTPFAHQTYFLIEGVVNQNIENTFLSNLDKNKPALIVITDALPFLDNDPTLFEVQLNSVPPGAVHVFRAFTEFVNRNYHKIKTIQSFKIFSLNK